jgi:sugar phosphate isomerase/epimerase
MIRVGCASLCCDGFDDTDFVHSFEILPEIGFEFIEFNCWHPRNLTPESVRSMKERCGASGLKATGVYGSGFGGSLVKDVAHKILMMDAAHKLGCQRIVAAGGPRSQGGTDDVIAVLREISAVAEELGISICLENHANSNMENADDYQRILDAIPSPALGVCLDTGHLDAAGVDIMAFIERFHSRTNHIHLKDNLAPGVKKFTRFGEGSTDNQQIVERYIELGYSGFLVVELSPEAYGLKMGSALSFQEVFDRKALQDAWNMFHRYERG